MESELAALSKSAGLFEVAVPEYKQLKACHREVRLLKQLWDMIVLVRAVSRRSRGTGTGKASSVCVRDQPHCRAEPPCSHRRPCILGSTGGVGWAQGSFSVSAFLLVQGVCGCWQHGSLSQAGLLLLSASCNGVFPTSG